MKAISIKQPWAGLIAAGLKNIENRSWMVKYRGPLVIVATKAPAPAGEWQRARALVKRLHLTFPEQLCKVNAAAVGVVDLAYIVGYDDRGTVITDPPGKTGGAWWNRDGYGWGLERARALTSPVPVSGRLGLYDLPEAAAAAIAAQLHT